MFTHHDALAVKMRRRRIRGLAARRQADAIAQAAQEAVDLEQVALERLARRMQTLAHRSAGLRGFAR